MFIDYPLDRALFYFSLWQNKIRNKMLILFKEFNIQLKMDLVIILQNKRKFYAEAIAGGVTRVFLRLIRAGFLE